MIGMVMEMVMETIDVNTYHIKTFGCQMNEHDSEIIAGMLENMGYSNNDTLESADIIILNTCSVRENADLRFFGNLGELKHIKKLRPDVVIAVCGCMMQQEHIIDTIKKKYSFVDIVFGTHNVHELPELLMSTQDKQNKVISVWDEAKGIVENLPVKRRYSKKALVNITYGCNNFCTYCIVPYTRGRERSREPEDIIHEVAKLAQEGTKEIMLLGQNVNSYGKTLDSDVDFSDLLIRLCDFEGIERIKFMTSHPKDLSDKLIETMRDYKKICNYIHLPVQSGSTKILKRMNRKYTKEDYLNLVDKLRKAIPDIGISTDIIVGFPGESKEDFDETLDLVKKARFDSAFTFIYSPRYGTPAAEYDDPIDKATKHEWFNELVRIQNTISAEKNEEYRGSIQDVMIEGMSKKNKLKLTGRTETNKLVNFTIDTSERDWVGEIVKVKITDSNTFNLEGHIVYE